MQTDLTLEKELNGLRVRTQGKASVNEMLSGVRAMLASDLWQVGMNMLADHSALDTSCLSMKDVKEIADGFSRLEAQIGNGRCAVVMSRPVDFGNARTWEMLTENKVSFQIRIFHAIGAAERWVRGEAVDEEA